MLKKSTSLNQAVFFIFLIIHIGNFLVVPGAAAASGAGGSPTRSSQTTTSSGPTGDTAGIGALPATPAPVTPIPVSDQMGGMGGTGGTDPLANPPTQPEGAGSKTSGGTGATVAGSDTSGSRSSNFATPPTDFVPLAGIPGLTTTRLNDLNLPGLLQTLYKLAITVGALIAVFQITLAGFKYMGSEVITSKEEARNDISSSLLGLLIILSTALILKTISGDLSLDIFNGAPVVNMSGGPDPTDTTSRGELPPTPTASNPQCEADGRMEAMRCPQDKRVYLNSAMGCSCAP